LNKATAQLISWVKRHTATPGGFDGGLLTKSMVTHQRTKQKRESRIATESVSLCVRMKS
jgi:hypothetical protein